MEVRDHTAFGVEGLIRRAVADYPTDGLLVEIRYCPTGSRRFASGTYYRRTTRREHGKLIRVRINRHNTYPVEMAFKTSQYYRRRNARGEVVVYQRMMRVGVKTPQDLIVALFLHEFSHYLDHIAGRNGRYKQTKADKFAVGMLQRLGVI